jgi:hypothetical protein
MTFWCQYCNWKGDAAHALIVTGAAPTCPGCGNNLTAFLQEPLIQDPTVDPSCPGSSPEAIQAALRNLACEKKDEKEAS